MPIYKTDKRKNGLQQYRVCVNYTDASGNYRQKSKLVYGSAEAKAEEYRLLKEYTGNTTVASRMTVSELYEEYKAAKVHELRSSTFEKTKAVIDNNIIPYLGDCRLDALTTKKLQSWKNQIASQGTSVRDQKNKYAALRALLYFAVKMEYLASNPLVRLGNFKDANDIPNKEKMHFYTPEQFKKYIAVVQSHMDNPSDYSYYVFFNLAFYTGMRKGELNALKWTDIENNIIHVRRSISQKLGQGDVETPPKTKSSYRDLQIPQKIVDMLIEHKARQQKIKNFSDDFRVCGGERPLRDTSISNKNIQYAKEAELEPIRIHDFRHSHASLLIQHGINIQEVARRLGHSDIKMTLNTYSHLYPSESERALTVLENI